MKYLIAFLFVILIFSCNSPDKKTTVTRDQDQIVVGQSLTVDNEAAKVALDENTFYIVLLTGDTLFTNDPVWKRYVPPVDTLPHENKQPVVNAGKDQTITLPTNTVTLSGFGNDPEGEDITYKWVKLTGGSGTITNPTSPNTTVTGLTQGSYQFRLAAIDEDGATGIDDIAITVNGAPPLPGNFQGYGSQTPGGTGGTVIHVISLTPEAMTAAWGSNRTIIFDVSGTVKGWKMPSKAVSFLTVDGTSNPVTFEGSSNNKGTIFAFDGSGFNNIIIKNIRVRGGVGAQDNDGDGINVVNGAHDIVFDHVSSSGNNDGNLDITSGANNITVQNCILGGGLGYGQTASWWSGTMLIAYSPVKNLSIHHNLFVPKTNGAVGERAPYVHSSNSNSANTLMVDFRNNAVINWTQYGSGYGYNSGGQFINNYYKSNSNPDRAIDPNADPSGNQGNQAGSMFYISGNVSGDGASFPKGSKSSPFESATVTTQSACEAAATIKTQAGCRPLDAVDQALINQLVIQNCSGQPNPDPPPNPTPGSYDGYTLIFSDYFNKDSDLDPQGHNQYAKGFIDYTLKFEGAGSFASRTGNVSSGTRSEVQLNSGSTPLEGVADYYIYYKSFASGSGHDVQLHPGNDGSGTGFYHVNGKLVFRSVSSGTDTYKDYPLNYTPPLNKWIHVQWFYKWAKSGGYSKIVFDGVTLVDAKNIQVGDGSTPSFKLGQNYWSGSGDQINYDKFDLYKKN